MLRLTTVPVIVIVITTCATLGYLFGYRSGQKNANIAAWTILKAELLLSTQAYLELAASYENDPVKTRDILRTLLSGYQMQRHLFPAESDSQYFSDTDKAVADTLKIIPPSPITPQATESAERRIIRVKPEQDAAANP